MELLTSYDSLTIALVMKGYLIFVDMGSFVKQIESNKEKLDFSFLGIHTINGMKYFVTVMESPTKAHHFIMEKCEDVWRIINKDRIPAWIMSLKNELIVAIKENEPKEHG